MEAMRAERRHEVVADMDDWTGGVGFYQGDTWLQFFYQKRKTGCPLFSFLYLYFFLLRIWLGHLFFRARHDASLAKREFAIGVLLGAFFVERDFHLPRRFDKDLTGLVEFGRCQELAHCLLLLGFRDLGEVNARVLRHLLGMLVFSFYQGDTRLQIFH
jgi:hypothetical protein